MSGSVNVSLLKGYADSIISVINTVLVPLLMAIAFIFFLWGAFNYFIYGADDETKRKEGRQFALWGVIGFVIIVSVWGLVNVVKDTLFPATGGSSQTAPKPPTI